jgi:bacteriorhodopsin
MADPIETRASLWLWIVLCLALGVAVFHAALTDAERRAAATRRAAMRHIRFDSCFGVEKAQRSGTIDD